MKVAIAGHFNPLHIGHLDLIREARALGDELIVIVANDEQAKRKRPKVFLPAKERAEIMEALKEVSSAVISIDTDTNVCKTLELVKPDIFASGCDENHPDAIEEKKVCDRLGIKAVYNIGGDKIRSSSEILRNYKSKVLFWKSAPIDEKLKFLTDPDAPLQVGIHEPKETRSSTLHFHRIYSEFFYVERGTITVELTDESLRPVETKVLNQGDAILILPSIGHRVNLPAGCRVWEVHQGAYVDDKVNFEYPRMV